LAAASLLATGDGPESLAWLFKGWSSYSPRVQTAILDAACARKDRLALVLDAIENKVIESSSIPPTRREQLLDDRDPAIRQRAKSLFSPRATNEERNRVFAHYQTALSLPRDANRGRQVFEAQCSKCHQLNGKGFAVAPDLSAINNRPDESLLLDILDPNSTIVAGYRAYTVDTVGGRVYSGVLTSETATSVTLRRELGAEDTILRKDIDAMFGSSLSLMPEGIEKLISPQDMANLIGYLRAALRGDGRRVLLFGGDPSFALVLNEGDGRAVVDSKESFAGSPSLRVSPPQRFSPRITGWDYKIVENPGPGEYRYLRFAWKAPGATGLMLELANDGAWPSAGEDRQRFYSGTNTTGWNAVRVSEQVPRDWVIVTRDLWKEFGVMRLTGLAPTAMNGDAFFARIELLPSLDAEANN
jgi:putative heme-binding domain-containing protein